MEPLSLQGGKSQNKYWCFLGRDRLAWLCVSIAEALLGTKPSIIVAMHSSETDGGIIGSSSRKSTWCLVQQALSSLRRSCTNLWPYAASKSLDVMYGIVSMLPDIWIRLYTATNIGFTNEEQLVLSSAWTICLVQEG